MYSPVTRRRRRLVDSHDKTEVHGAGSHLIVTIVTPSGTRAEYNVRHVRVPGIEGDYGVLKGHIPFMTALRSGALIIDLDKEQKIWAVSGGFSEVHADRVTILAETAEPAESIDLERSESSRKRALKRLAERNMIQNFDATRAHASLARAINRIEVASGLGHN